MLDMECKWMQRELDDKLVYAPNDLRESLKGLLRKVSSTEEGLRESLARLPDRERLALKCMLARDIFHIAVLYETFLRTSPAVPHATGAMTEAPPEVDRRGEAVSPLVFQESLFG
jgi:hypothetical protein